MSEQQGVVHAVYECAYVWFVLDSVADPELVELFDDLINSVAGFFAEVFIPPATVTRFGTAYPPLPLRHTRTHPNPRPHIHTPTSSTAWT